MSTRAPVHPFVTRLLLVGLLALVAFLPRVLHLDVFVTPDEPYWLVESANFYFALGQRDFAATYRMEHPGVTTLWAGVAGFLSAFPAYRGTGVGMVGIDDHEAVFSRLGHTPLDLLAAGRLFNSLSIVLVLALVFLYASRLVGVWPASAGFLLVALDPFHLGLSRLLHNDALLSVSMLLSALALVSFYQKGRSWLDLLVSAAAAGASWLTKSPGIFLLPYAGLLALLDLWDTRRQPVALSWPRHLWRAAIPLGAWVLGGAVVFVALWPAMWVNPVGTLREIYGMALVSVHYGHITPSFFNGQYIPDGRIGWEYWYFYPLTYLWRSTPVTLLGLLAAAFGAITRRGIFVRKDTRRYLAALLLFALFYTLFMSLGTKKFDRYLLPVYAPLDLVAGVGWVWLAGIAGQYGPALWRRAALPVSLGLIILAQAAFSLPTHPYYLSYYNPLMGGSRLAPQSMIVGIGEGLDQAAHYLDSKPDSENLNVLVWYDVGSFSYFFDGETRYIPIVAELEEGRLERLLDADYAVIYIHQWQRRTPRQLLEFLNPLTPEHTISIDGIEYVRIYRLDT